MSSYTEALTEMNNIIKCAQARFANEYPLLTAVWGEFTFMNNKLFHVSNNTVSVRHTSLMEAEMDIRRKGLLSLKFIEEDLKKQSIKQAQIIQKNIKGLPDNIQKMAWY